ncbi:MAG TPA: ParB N-terminal domain-containing protein [Bacteroidia bacterium]|nr:ParB N-terminal domain-containing protein [Bacteroidia bacterium]
MKNQAAAKGKTETKSTNTKTSQPMKATANKTESKKAQPELEKKNYVMVPVNLIVIDEKLNPREDYGNIDELMASIAENGIRNAVKGFQKDGKIYLREGFRRMRAVKLAIEKGFQIDRVPMLLEERAMTEEERTLEFLINNDGKPFTMLEQSEVIRRLLNFGWKVIDIVKKTGKARGYIENLIHLTKVPLKVHNFIKEDKISAHAVIQIIAASKGNVERVVEDVEAAMQKAKEAGKEKATPKHVENKQVKGQSYGKFYKWAEEIADLIAGKKETYQQKQEVLDKLMISFENGQSAKQMAETYFTDKSKVPAKPAASKTDPAKKSGKK